MKIHVDIDDELMSQALAACDLPTAADVIEEALRLVIALSERADLGELLDQLDSNKPTRH